MVYHKLGVGKYWYMSKHPKYITKKAEYKLLLQLIKRHKILLSKGRGYNIQAIVKTLQIDPKTARRWLRTPKAQRAISEEIEYYISKMQEVGANDWRQWAKQVEFATKTKNNDKEINNSNVVIVKDREKGVFTIGENEN